MVIDPCKELYKACVVAARLLKMTTDLTTELVAIELETVAAGPRFNLWTQASVEPTEDHQASFWFAVSERRAVRLGLEADGIFSVSTGVLTAW